MNPESQTNPNYFRRAIMAGAVLVSSVATAFNHDAPSAAAETAPAAVEKPYDYGLGFVFQVNCKLGQVALFNSQDGNPDTTGTVAVYLINGTLGAFPIKDGHSVHTGFRPTGSTVEISQFVGSNAELDIIELDSLQPENKIGAIIQISDNTGPGNEMTLSASCSKPGETPTTEVPTSTTEAPTPTTSTTKPTTTSPTTPSTTITTSPTVKPLATTPTTTITPTSPDSIPPNPAEVPGYGLVASDGSMKFFDGRKYVDAPLLQGAVAGDAIDSGREYITLNDKGAIETNSSRLAELKRQTAEIKLKDGVEFVDVALTPSGEGFWIVASDGSVFGYGDAEVPVGTGDIPLKAPIAGIAAHPGGKGFWLVAVDGGVFTYGTGNDIKFHGSTGDTKLNQPVVGIEATPSGNGYWLVAADGGIFAFGDAVFRGSTGNIKLSKPVVAMQKSTGSGGGYWLAAEDGGVFAYGNAPFLGSAVTSSTASPKPKYVGIVS